MQKRVSPEVKNGLDNPRNYQRPGTLDRPPNDRPTIQKT
jgi:hypothetical protein